MKLEVTNDKNEIVCSISSTDCCALGQLRAKNDTTLSQLQELIGLAEAEATEDKDWLGTANDAGGKTALFAVTTNTEENLAQNLETIGFIKGAEFERRKGYGKGYLSHWFMPLI